MSRQVDTAAFFAQGGQVGNGVGTQLIDRAALEVGPARVGELTVMEGRRAFPLSLGTKGVVENLGHFLGESIFKRASSAPDGERQSHDVVLLKSPVDVRLRLRTA